MMVGRTKLVPRQEFPGASLMKSVSENEGAGAEHHILSLALDSPACYSDSLPYGEVSGIAARPDIRRAR